MLPEVLQQHVRSGLQAHLRRDGRLAKGARLASGISLA